jgi:hypothetical protein
MGYQEIVGTLRNSMFNCRYQEFKGTLGDTAIYKFEKNTGCNDGFLGQLVGLEWRKGIVGVLFSRCMGNLNSEASAGRALLEF